MKNHFEVNPLIEEYTSTCICNTTTDASLYEKYDVKRGLRDVNGVGVLSCLTAGSVENTNE